MRPITPQLLLETLRLARCNPFISLDTVQKALLLSWDRSREVLNQMESMGLLSNDDNGYQLSDRGIRLLRAGLADNLQMVHQVLLQYSPYATVYKELKEKAMTLDEIARHTKMSKVAVDIVLRLINWTHPKLTKNPQTDRYYIAYKNVLSEEEFLNVLFSAYKEHSAPSAFGMRRLYVKISTLRGLVCERLGITKETFDELLRETASRKSNLIELASAPLISASGKPFILNPRGKSYYYVRIQKAFHHEKA